MTEHYFLYSFGVDGTLASVPNPTQVSGTVSYQAGFPIGYQLSNVAPGYLSIPRDQFNQILYDVTGAIQQIQQTGFPSFITSAANGGSPYSYALGAEVWYSGVPYRSLLAGNTDTPPTANWQVIGQNRSLYYNWAADTGSANHIIIAPNPALASLTDGAVVNARPAFGISGACDLNVNGLGAVAIKTLANADPVTGMIIPSGQYQFVYNGTTGFWVLQNPSLGSAAYLTAGTDANNVLQLTSGGVIPNGLGVFKSVKLQTFVAGGTYTPSAGVLFAIVEAQAGGGGGGGANGNAAIATGGGAGSYSRSILTAATIGASQTVTIGAAGTGGSAAGGTGGTGGATSLGSLVTTNGGVGGIGSTSASSQYATAGVAGGAVGTGDITIAGMSGGSAFAGNNGPGLSGVGGNSMFGFGGAAVPGETPAGTLSGAVGNAGVGYGSGGSGATYLSHAGGAGRAGIVIITEFCSQ